MAAMLLSRSSSICDVIRRRISRLSNIEVPARLFARRDHTRARKRERTNIVGKDSALLIIDFQYDFIDGALPVRDALGIADKLNAVRAKFSTVVLTRDAHPPNHVSFASRHGAGVNDVRFLTYRRNDSRLINVSLTESCADEQCVNVVQRLWPDHCIDGSEQSRIHVALWTRAADFVLSKGEDADVDSYSAFFDNPRLNRTTLEPFLTASAVNRVYISGIALDHCVLETALDSVRLGFETFVITDATVSVADDKSEAVAKATSSMKSAGVHLITTADV